MGATLSLASDGQMSWSGLDWPLTSSASLGFRQQPFPALPGDARVGTWGLLHGSHVLYHRATAPPKRGFCTCTNRYKTFCCTCGSLKPGVFFPLLCSRLRLLLVSVTLLWLMAFLSNSFKANYRTAIFRTNKSNDFYNI